MWVGHVACIWDKGNVYSFLGGAGCYGGGP